MLFINVGGSCYHFSPDLFCLSVLALSLSHWFSTSPSSLFFLGAPWPVSGTSLPLMKLHQYNQCLPILMCLYLPKLVHVHMCICLCVCSFNTVQLETCCEVLHILAACSNASFHFTAKLSLILCRTGSALAVFVNVKHAAPRAVFCWVGLWNNHPCPGEINTLSQAVLFQDCPTNIIMSQ